jgi:hypothetical protein
MKVKSSEQRESEVSRLKAKLLLLQAPNGQSLEQLFNWSQVPGVIQAVKELDDFAKDGHSYTGKIFLPSFEKYIHLKLSIQTRIPSEVVISSESRGW